MSRECGKLQGHSVKCYYYCLQVTKLRTFISKGAQSVVEKPVVRLCENPASYSLKPSKCESLLTVGRPEPSTPSTGPQKGGFD